MTPTDTAAAKAYEHVARLLENRMAISCNVDGDHAEAVCVALAPIMDTMRDCAAALKRCRPIDLRDRQEAVR